MPSQVIAGFSYDTVSRTLFVAFTSGDLYAYRDVPPEVPVAFRGAFSKGRYFAAHVRDRFAYHKMEEAEARLLRPQIVRRPSPPSAGPASPPRAGAGRSA